MLRYFEDLVENSPIAGGSFRFSAEEIIAFGRQYDPQPFHIDRQLAEDSIFGGLVASSLQSHLVGASIVMGHLRDVATIAGLGWEKTRLFRPVRPNVDYEVSARWTSLRPSRTHPDRGVASIGAAVTEINGTEVMTFGFSMLVHRRPGITGDR